jgi:hypothetical protein
MIGNQDANKASEGIPVLNRALGIHQRNLEALSRAVTLALEQSRSVLDSYGELVSRTHRQVGVLLWRQPTHADQSFDPKSSKKAVEETINTVFGHVAEIVGIATKLQMESLAIFKRSALDTLNLLEPPRFTDTSPPRESAGVAGNRSETTCVVHGVKENDDHGSAGRRIEFVGR